MLCIKNHNHHGAPLHTNKTARAQVRQQCVLVLAFAATQHTPRVLLCPNDDAHVLLFHTRCHHSRNSRMLTSIVHHPVDLSSSATTKEPFKKILSSYCNGSVLTIHTFVTVMSKESGLVTFYFSHLKLGNIFKWMSVPKRISELSTPQFLKHHDSS